jgi:hypothetical protein
MHAEISFTGRLVDADTGAGLDGAIVSTLHDQTVTNENGYFDLRTDSLDTGWMIRFIGYESQFFEAFDTPANIDELTNNGNLPIDVGTLKMVRDYEATTFPEVNIVADRPAKKNNNWLWLLIIGAAAVIASDKK